MDKTIFNDNTKKKT